MTADVAVLQKYIESMKALANDNVRATEKQNLINSALKDSSQVAKDAAQYTDNLDDVMKVYTASTKTATSVAEAFKTTLLGIGKTIGIAILASIAAAALSKALQLADEKLFHPYEHARDKAAEMSQAHEEATQKVEELTKQVEELKAKMDECRSTTTGTIVDPESYAVLEQQREQLQTNLNLAKALADETAKESRNAVYEQQDAKQNVFYILQYMVMRKYMMEINLNE